MPTPEQTIFTGYSPPGSNTTYTPNQFFDVVLPNASRGVVRVVGYMLRRILGWSDSNGDPLQPQVSFTYTDLIEKANVSRSMIKQAIDEAVQLNFIRCIREPRAKSAGQSAVSGLYELCWSDDPTYVKDLASFRGFYSANGNLTNIPNDFFDYTVREEPLSVVRVVGSIIRNTIGFETRFGFRRREVRVPFSRLHYLTGISSRDQLSEAIQAAVSRGHIIKVVEGQFKAGSSKDSITSVYAVRWRDGITGTKPARKDSEINERKKFAESGSARKTPAVGAPTQDVDRPAGSIRKVDRELMETLAPSSDSRAGAGVRSRGTSVRKTDRRVSDQRYENRTENGSKTEPGSVGKVDPDRSENRTDIEITNEITTNNSSKGAAAASEGSFELLMKTGFDKHAAQELCSRFSEDSIRCQLELLPKRNATKNRLGLLRRAIEEDWPPPREANSPHQGRVAPKRTSSEVVEQGDTEYQSFIAAEGSRLWKSDRNLVEAFEGKDRRVRLTLESTGLISPEIRDRIVQGFGDELQRAKRWTQFLLDQRRIPTHSAWLIRFGKKTG